MLQSLDRLRHHELLTRVDRAAAGNDGPERHGHRFTIADIVFDQQDFSLRYFVADTGNWMPGRKVLVAPEAVVGADWDNEVLQTNLTEDEIRDAPPLMSDAPISLTYRRNLALHHGWSAYTSFHPILGGYGWMRAGDVPTGAPPTSGLSTPPPATEADRPAPDETGPDTMLRSADEISGYDIQGTDDGVGHLEDLIVDTGTWTIRYLMIDTVNWLPFGRKVLVPVGMLRDISFPDRHVAVALTKEQIKNSPEFDGTFPISPQQEVDLFGSYARVAR